MTKQYLESIVQDIHSILQDRGRVTFNMMAEYYDLPPNFIKDLMSGNLWDDESIDVDGINT